MANLGVVWLAGQWCNQLSELIACLLAFLVRGTVPVGQLKGEAFLLKQRIRDTSFKRQPVTFWQLFRQIDHNKLGSCATEVAPVAPTALNRTAWEGNRCAAFADFELVHVQIPLGKSKSYCTGCSLMVGRIFTNSRPNSAEMPNFWRRLSSVWPACKC